MVAVVLPSLKFAPPASETVSGCAFAHAGSAAPAARSGACSTLIAVTVSCADAWAGNAAAPIMESANSDDDVFIMTRDAPSESCDARSGRAIVHSLQPGS